MSYGTMLSKDSFVTTSRDSDRASRVLKRAMIAGLNSAGVSVRDLEVVPASVNRFDLKRGKAAGGIHVRVSPDNPEEVEILFFEPPGIPIDAKRERSIENYYHREDFRRASRDEMGSIMVPPRAVEAYLQSLLENWDTVRIRARAPRVVLDYSFSASSLLLPSILDRLGAEVMSINAFTSDAATYSRERDVPTGVEKVSRLVAVMEADVGVLFDPAAEHLTVVDETGARMTDETLLLLLLRHACNREGPGTVALPLNVTRFAEEVAEQCGAVVTRTKNSNASLMAEAANPTCHLRSQWSGRLHIPDLPAQHGCADGLRQGPGTPGLFGIAAFRIGAGGAVCARRPRDGSLFVAHQGRRDEIDDRATQGRA